MAKEPDTNDKELAARAAALFGAISLTLSTLGCASQAPPAVGDGVVVAPTVSGVPVPTTSPTPAPVAEPSATAPMASTAPKPPKRRSAPTTVEGRPFLVEGAPRLASLGPGSAWTDAVDLDGTIIDPGERELLVRHYTDWALAEHASIASFARFALQLLALGAPSSLVARATEAMADETRHARLGFGLVRAISGRAIEPAALCVDRALDGETTLEHVLRLTVREGMIGETLAALEVRTAADRTTLPWLRAALTAVAYDEARHAELAFAFAAWALARAPELAAVVDAEIAATEPAPLTTCLGLARFGVLDAANRQSVRDHGWSRVVLPLVAALAAARAA